MHSSGVGVYIVTIAWCIGILLCWVSVRTGTSYIGKIALAITIVTTVIWIQLPKGGVDLIIANLGHPYFVFRLLTLVSLTVSLVLGVNYLFVYIFIPPVETERVQYVGRHN